MNDSISISPNESIPSKSETDSSSTLLQFIISLLKSLSIEELRRSYRVTPKGLFISRSVNNQVLTAYQSWINKQTSLENKLSEHKLRRKIFGTEEPELLYLLEGQSSLVGSLIPCPIDNPQNLRVPYYLGTLSSAKEYLDASDPIFSELPGVQATNSSSGLNVYLTVSGSKIRIPLPALGRFRALAGASHQVQKRYPQYDSSLSECVRALVGTLERARFYKPNEEPIRPLKWENSKGIRFLERWGMVFALDASLTVQYIYHLYGRNLYSLIRDEVSGELGRQAKASFQGLHLYRRDHQLLGSIQLHGKNTQIHGHALCSFIHAKLEDLTPVKQPRTVKYYLSEFLMVLLIASPIDPRKLTSQLKPQFRRGHSIFVNQRWIFVINKSGVLVETISRFRETANKNKNVQPLT